MCGCACQLSRLLSRDFKASDDVSQRLNWRGFSLDLASTSWRTWLEAVALVPFGGQKLVAAAAVAAASVASAATANMRSSWSGSKYVGKKARFCQCAICGFLCPTGILVVKRMNGRRARLSYLVGRHRRRAVGRDGNRPDQLNYSIYYIV